MATTRTEPQTAPPTPSPAARERTWLWVALIITWSPGMPVAP